MYDDVYGIWIEDYHLQLLSTSEPFFHSYCTEDGDELRVLFSTITAMEVIVGGKRWRTTGRQQGIALLPSMKFEETEC